MAIRIPQRVAKKIVDDARAQVPNEACGLIAGDGKTIQSAIPLANVASSKRSSFSFEPNEQLGALKRLDAEDLVWMGVYHSHPNSAAIPSIADLEGAGDHGLLQLIVSLKSSKPELQLWRIGASGVAPLELIFDTQTDAGYDEPPLSQQQRAAIVTTAVISLILMLVISFALLPPAPASAPLP
ncbi:MAG: M67 family metallopeptidase [Chloroflexota bacterium]|nr:M67 family metallopeptidase [Chloroflexota bacterium]